MNNIAHLFRQVSRPVAGVLIYEQQIRQQEYHHYAESFDVDDQGRPCNLHPLTVDQAKLLARKLESGDIDLTKRRRFLVPSGIMPESVLYLSAIDESVVWYTKPMKRSLFFIDYLQVPNGIAYVPGMIWAATRTKLKVYALSGSKRPTDKTKLYRAPFYNVYDTGSVCLGNVKTKLPETSSLESFIEAWEHSFFGSYFSHLNAEPTTVNTPDLWKGLISTDKRFPVDVLKPSTIRLTSLLR